MTPRSTRPHAEATRPAPVANWSQLSRADHIQIRQNGELIADGRIDMLAVDGSTLWLHLANGQGRALFLQSDGLKVFRCHAGTAD
jgi:hypothetical protein